MKPECALSVFVFDNSQETLAFVLKYFCILTSRLFTKSFFKINPLGNRVGKCQTSQGSTETVGAETVSAA